MPLRRARKTRFSRIFMRLYRPRSSGRYPTRSSKGRVSGWPKRRTEPESGTVMPIIMRMELVLPAPLGPSRPKISPSGISQGEFIDGDEFVVGLGDMIQFQHEVHSCPVVRAAALQPERLNRACVPGKSRCPIVRKRREFFNLHLWRQPGEVAAWAAGDGSGDACAGQRCALRAIR